MLVRSSVPLVSFEPWTASSAHTLQNVSNLVVSALNRVEHSLSVGSVTGRHVEATGFSRRREAIARPAGRLPHC